MFKHKILSFTGLIAILALIWPKISLAFCPVCTIAVGAGLGLAEWLGIDDSITGLWIGGLTVSLIVWTINWLNKKNIRFMFRKILVVIIYYFFIALALIPLWQKGSLGHPAHSFYKGPYIFEVAFLLDKMIFSIILGSVLFLVGGKLYEIVKKKNGGKAHFPFEKIAFSLVPLIIFSIIFYFITR